MALRWFSALLGIPLFLGICLWGVVPFTLGVLALAITGLIEMYKVYRSQGIYPNPFFSLFGLLGPLCPFWEAMGGRPILLTVLSLCFLAFLWEVVKAGHSTEIHTGRDSAYGLLCGFYIFLFGGLTVLRSWPDRTINGFSLGLETGSALVLLITFSVWATDSFAFFVGRWWGRRRLVPRLSPGKTLEGAIGGGIAGILVGLLLGFLFFRSLSLGLLAGALGGILGQIGDLFQSGLKREVNVKDISSLIPGHGGVLDRFDSLLLAGALFALILSLIPF